MPSVYAGLKVPFALIFIFAVLIAVLSSFAPSPIPPPDPRSFGPGQDEAVWHLKHSQRTSPLTSQDLYRFRGNGQDNIVPPSDRLQAELHLKRIERLWYELKEISQEEGFRREGFAVHTKLGDWKRRLDTLRSNGVAKDVVGSDIYRLTDNLLAVGIDYATNPFFREKDSVLEEWFTNYYLPVARESVVNETSLKKQISIQCTDEISPTISTEAL